MRIYQRPRTSMEIYGHPWNEWKHKTTSISNPSKIIAHLWKSKKFPVCYHEVVNSSSLGGRRQRRQPENNHWLLTMEANRWFSYLVSGFRPQCIKKSIALCVLLPTTSPALRNNNTHSLQTHSQGNRALPSGSWRKQLYTMWRNMDHGISNFWILQVDRNQFWNIHSYMKRGGDSWCCTSGNMSGRMFLSTSACTGFWTQPCLQPLRSAQM